MEVRKYLVQANNMSHKLINTIPFIVNNKLWEGFFQHKLVMIVSTLSAIAIPWSILKYLGSKVDSYQDTPVTVMGALNSGTSFSSLMDGGNKYLVIILIQMLTVYFSNKTIEHISGVTIHMSLREMVDSQIRVIKLSIRNWAFELVIGIGISIVLGIFGPHWLKAPANFIIACYFVGFIFMDNYNHAYAIKIKDSAVIVRRHLGATLMIGLVAKILFLLPIIGAFFVSLICSVGATWYMHTSEDRQVGKAAYAD